MALLEQLTAMPTAITEHNPYVRRWNSDTGETYYEHRSVAEQKLGRPLMPDEVVHHKDGNKQHNALENIMVFSNQRAHMLFEHYMAREAAGVQHIFSIKEVLMLEGLWMLE